MPDALVDTSTEELWKDKKEVTVPGPGLSMWEAREGKGTSKEHVESTITPKGKILL